MRDDDYTDQEVIDIAKRYAYRTFEQSIKSDCTGGKDPIPRHRQNNATKIVGYLMKQSEQEDKAPELGVILASMRESFNRSGEALAENEL